jgi:hypothetical protein
MARDLKYMITYQSPESNMLCQYGFGALEDAGKVQFLTLQKGHNEVQSALGYIENRRRTCDRSPVFLQCNGM